MTPYKVRFTGLEFDPDTVIRERCLKGVIPPLWQRHSFAIERSMTFPVPKLNRWLHENIEGRWAIYSYYAGLERRVAVAFEHDFDAMTFLLSDGKTEAFRES